MVCRLWPVVRTPEYNCARAHAIRTQGTLPGIYSALGIIPGNSRSLIIKRVLLKAFNTHLARVDFLLVI
jgi:hypothetical protein